ncbi:MAG TPA: hypothetical protein V6C97_32675 [Oculatellaceae cyanobacterium]
MANRKKLDVNGNVTLTEKQRQALVDSALKHTDRVNSQRVTYPKKGVKLSLPDLKALGFTDVHEMFVIEDDDIQGYRGRRRKGKGKRRDRDQGQGQNRGKGGGSRGGGGGGKSLPNPDEVADEVERHLADVPLAGMDDENLAVGEQNFENLDESKADFFDRAIAAIVRRHHLMFCIEVSPEGLARIAKHNPDYTAHVSAANNRQQAVGFLVHKRLRVLKVTEYSSVAKVFGIPDLRSAFRLDLEDTKTGIKFSVVVVHMKSMRGGEAKTSPVRTQQSIELVRCLGNGAGAAVPLPAYGKLRVFAWFNNPKLGRKLTDHALLRITIRLDKVTCTKDGLILIAGDWNSKLDTAKDLQPLYDAGWLLAYKNDGTGTQIMGPSRLDGFVGNGDNDHSCGGGNEGDPHGPFSNDPSESPAVDMS